MLVKIITAAIFFAYCVLAKHNCDVREENLDIVFDCCDKSVNDENYHDMLESIQRDVQDEKNVKVLRNVHVLMENNRISYLKRLPLLSHVSKLSFKHNRLADADTGVFRYLPQLKIVDFGSNELTGDNLTAEIFRGNEVHDRFESLAVEYLSLSNNHITFLHQDLFKYLPNLVSLELNNNPINHFTRETARALYSLKKLKILNLAQVRISQIPDMLLEAIPIETLFLHENYFVEVPITLSQCSTLKYLNLNDNPLKEIDSRSFTKLIHLEELHLSSMKNLTTIKENTFKTLENLELLQCSFNPQLKSIHPNAFSWSSNSKLQELSINDNALQDLPEKLINWKQLEVLNLRGNPWNCTCSLQWLYTLIRQRQLFDPEANLGIRCQYPEELSKRSLITVGGYLKCDTENDTMSSLSTTKSKNLIVCMLFLALVYVTLQFIYFKRMQNKSKPRHTGTSIKSTVKYKPAQSTIYL